MEDCPAKRRPAPIGTKVASLAVKVLVLAVFYQAIYRYRPNFSNKAPLIWGWREVVMNKTKTIFLEIIVGAITAGVLALPAFYGFYILMNWMGYSELPNPGIGESIFLAVTGIYPCVIPVAGVSAISGVAGGELIPRLTRNRVSSMIGALIGAIIGVVITTVIVLSQLDWASMR
jgi:hypothetical protein